MENSIHSQSLGACHPPQYERNGIKIKQKEITNNSFPLKIPTISVKKILIDISTKTTYPYLYNAFWDSPITPLSICLTVSLFANFSIILAFAEVFRLLWKFRLMIIPTASRISGYKYCCQSQRISTFSQ